MKKFVHNLAHLALSAAGLSAVRTIQTYEADRHATLRRAGIDLVIDVGANIGQYGGGLRRRGYDGAIVSLEPLPSAYDLLKRSARFDTKWTVINAAVGDKATRSSFNISADSVCSSLLQPSSALLDAIPNAKIVKTVDVEVICLEQLPLPDHQRIALKLDVQGFERQALAGAGNLLAKIDILELELSVDPGYQEAYTLTRALPELSALGFEVVSLGRGVSNPTTGKLLDLDVLMERRQ